MSHAWQVFVVHVDRLEEVIPVTSDRYNSWSPSWSLDGNWLYFLSERQLDHGGTDVFGIRGEQPSHTMSTTVYAVPRRPDVAPPWRSTNELADEAEALRGRHEAAGAAAPTAETPTAAGSHPGWGFDGGPAEAGRWVEHLPVPLGAYLRLRCVAHGRLLLAGKLNDELLVIDAPKAAGHGDLEAKLVAKQIASDFKVSPNGERVLVRSLDTNKLHVLAVDWPHGADELKAELDAPTMLRTADLVVEVEPQVEWREVFVDAWRQARDTFWDRSMGGVDWAGCFREHERLLKRVGSRDELADLVTRMLAQLRVLHCFAQAPVHAHPGAPSHGLAASRPTTPAFLGATLRAADDLSGVEVLALHDGDPERPSERSPLSSPHFGTRVRPREVISEVNGVPTPTVAALARALLEQGGKQVRLRIQSPLKASASSRTSALSSSSSSSSSTLGRPAMGLSSLAAGTVSTAVSALTSQVSSIAPGLAAGVMAATGIGGGQGRAPRSGAPGGDGEDDGFDPYSSAPHPRQLRAGREVVVVPISQPACAELRHAAWLERTRLLVEGLGKGRVGYVSLRSMGHRAMCAFAEQFYPNHTRPALLLDVRHNRGGNIDAWMLERLLRKAWLYFAPRHGGGWWNMPYAFRGHMAVLVDQQTQSNAEAFAEGFRRAGLGPVLGMRTWGGQIWMAHGQWLQDSGRLGLPEIGAYSAEGEWLIEGVGVEPDVRVDNGPHATHGGADAQLEAGVQLLLDKLEKEPVAAPAPPPYPRRGAPPPSPPA